MNSKQLTEGEVSAIFQVSKDKLRHDRMLRQGPPFRKYGRIVRYDEIELAEWMAQQTQATGAGVK